MKIIFYLDVLFLVLFPCVCLSETLVSCPQSDSCNISIYKSSNSTMFGSHTITLIPPQDNDGNNLPLTSSCEEPFIFIEERNRCETTETACSSEGVFNSSTSSCEVGTICESTGGELDTALGICWKYPDCDTGGSFNRNPDAMWCEAELIADYSCPAGEFRVVNGEGRCEIAPHCIEPGVYNPETGQCEITVSTQCPEGGEYDQEHNICIAAASEQMCQTDNTSQVCYTWLSYINPCNLGTKTDCYLDFLGNCYSYWWANGQCFEGYTEVPESVCQGFSPCTDSNGQTYTPYWVPAQLTCPGELSCYVWPIPPNCPGNIPPDDAILHCAKNATNNATQCSYSSTCSSCPGNANFYIGHCRLIEYWSIHGCPAGYIWDGVTCSTPASIDTCPLGYSQAGNLCYRDPDPCPVGWSLDSISGGSNLCYMLADAQLSCPPSYTFLEVSGEYHCVGTPHCFGSYSLNNTTKLCESEACPDGYDFEHGSCSSDDICAGAALFDQDYNVCYLNITGDLVHIEYDGVRYSIRCNGTEQILGDASVARDCPFPLEWDGTQCSGEVQCSNGTYDSDLKRCVRDTICESTNGQLVLSEGICRKLPDCEYGGAFNSDPAAMRCEAEVISDLSCPSGTLREVDSKQRCEQQPNCLSPSIYNPATGQCEFTIGTVCPPGGSLGESGQCEASVEEKNCYTESGSSTCYTWLSYNPYGLPGGRDDCFLDFSGICFWHSLVNGSCIERTTYKGEGGCILHGVCTDQNGQAYPPRWEPSRLTCPGELYASCNVWPAPACAGNVPPDNSVLICEKNATNDATQCGYASQCNGLTGGGGFVVGYCKLHTYWNYSICPDGYTNIGSACTAPPSYQTCPSGFMQEDNLCYRNPAPCPTGWTFDGGEGGTNLCYIVVEANYSCPPNYTLTEINGNYYCIGVPFCRTTGYTLNNATHYCESPACSSGYTYDTNGICTSENLCPPTAVFDPDNNLCYLEIEVDEVESSPEDIANTIICTIGENGDSINATLSLYDQETYDYPYANAPGYGIDPSLDGTNRNNPVCVNDEIHRTEACKWQRYNDDNEWLNDMGVPLNSWIIYGNTHVHNLTLGYLVESNSGFSGSDNICARDINDDGSITENEIMMCVETPQGDLCPIELAECEVSTTPIVCPGNGTWDPDRNRCWKATTDNNLLCTIGSWVPEHNQCEATIECPAAAGYTPVYNNEHDICEYPISCPDSGIWHNTRDICELMPVCNTTLNGTRPSYNVGAQRCETPITTEYNCPAGALRYDRNGTIICTRLPICNTGDSYVCRNHRCERAATPVCASGHVLENNRCYRPADLTNCYTERDEQRLASSRVPRLCHRAYDLCSNGQYGTWYGGGINNRPSACGHSESCTVSSVAGTYGYALDSPTCYARDSYGTRTGQQCPGNNRPSGSISVGVDQYPYVHMIGNNTGALNCYFKEFWGVSTCPSGYTLSGNRCWRQPNYTCPSGYTLSGNICYRSPSCSTYGTGWAFDSSLNPDSACPAGYGLCWTNSTPVTVCPTGYTIEDSICTHYSDHSCPSTAYQFSPSTGMCQYSGFECTGNYALSTVFNVCGFSDVCPERTNHDVANDVCASSRSCVDPYELSTAENLCLTFEHSCPEFYHANLINDICYHDWPDLCPYGTEYACMNNNGLWQCSPHICEAFNNVLEDTDTIEGENDINEIGFEEDGSCAGEIYIFRGFDKRCRTSGTTTSFVNCCGTASSNECINNLWLGYQPCNAREKDLACRKTADLCIEVGEYCSKRIRLLSGSSCIEHKKTYCCFGSKFGRVLQEQGRPLLKDFDPIEPFGTPKSPICDGFTPEQFSLLNWEEIDLTELYPDIEVMPMDDFENAVNARFQNQLNTLELPGP